VVIVRAENIDVRAIDAPSALRPIDPQHDLMPGAAVSDAARAFEFHGPWSLSVIATYYRLAEIKHTSIERAFVRTVITRAGETVVEGIYAVRSAQQRLPVELPADARFDTQPVHINGRPVTVESGDQNRYFIPLTQQSPDEPFLLTLRYVTAESPYLIEPSRFVDDPAIQKQYLAVHIPDERRLMHVSGPWTREFTWSFGSLLRWVPQLKQNERHLLNWVRGGIAVSGNPGDSFQTDGRAFLFSTIGATADGGALHLTTISGNVLSAMIIIVVIGGGLLLLRTGAATRWLAIGTLVVVLILVGVFLPVAGRQLTGGLLIAGLAITLIVWFVQFVRRRERVVRETVEPWPDDDEHEEQQDDQDGDDNDDDEEARS